MIVTLQKNSVTKCTILTIGATMTKFKLFGYKITIEKEGEKQERATKAKINNSLKKIEEALKVMEEKQVQYSEYALQKESGLSINTIKKYRPQIDEIRAKEKGLFA